MTDIAEFDRHSNQLQMMAGTLGVNLGQAVLTDKLRNFPFRDMVFRCSKCRQKSACDAWLEEHDDGAAEAPEYCWNKTLLEGLQK